MKILTALLVRPFVPVMFELNVETIMTVKMGIHGMDKNTAIATANVVLSSALALHHAFQVKILFKLREKELFPSRISMWEIL